MCLQPSCACHTPCMLCSWVRRVARMEREARESGDMCAKLEKEYPWIRAEKRLFGQAGSDYDWSARCGRDTGLWAELAVLSCIPSLCVATPSASMHPSTPSLVRQDVHL